MFTKLLKCSNVAQILGISKALAYRLIAERQLASVRFGRTVRVKPDDLEIFIQRNSSDPFLQRGGEKLIISNLE